jgi:hypothetical protein
MTNYHPTWTSDSKPEHNSGIFVFIGLKIINLGESHEGTLYPLVPELWNAVRTNDVLKCMEGSKQVGEAVVLEIIE